jgi:hypothetical protein
MNWLKTTLKLWWNVPGSPSILDCVVVAWMVTHQPPVKNKMGKYDIENTTEEEEE